MRTLRLVALSDDGKSLILTAESTDGSDEFERFELPIDERVRAAARGDARLGAIEDLGNTLPPRVTRRASAPARRPSRSPSPPAPGSSGSCASPTPCCRSASGW